MNFKIKNIPAAASNVRNCETGSAAHIPLVPLSDKTAKLIGVNKNGSRYVTIFDTIILPVEYA